MAASVLDRYAWVYPPRPIDFLEGTRERYAGKAHDTKDLVEKAKLDIVVFRSVFGPQRS